MQISSVPTKMPTIWGAGAGAGYIRVVPIPSQIGTTPGAASFTDGFPPLTMTALNAGGVPPFGQDVNGVLNALSAWSQWQQAGAPVAYDSSFSSSIGGYPKGAVIAAASFPGSWLSIVDNNTTNPDSGGAGWVPTNLVPNLSTVTGGSHTASIADNVVRRSNAGTAMSDALPGGAAVMPQGWSATYVNVDASAILAFSTGSGALVNGTAASFIYVGPGQSIRFASDGTGYVTSVAPQRCRLGSATSIFVSTTGSDTANHGLTAASPFATMQKAWNFAQSQLDLAGFQLSANLAAGTFTAGLAAIGPLVGGATGANNAPILFTGSSSAIVSVTNATAFAVTQGAAIALGGGLSIAATGSSGSQGIGVFAAQGGIIRVGNVTFGACGQHHMQALADGSIVLDANYSVTGGAVAHYYAHACGTITQSAAVTVTITGTPAFSTAFAWAQMGEINLPSVTFSGGTTGQRYAASLNGVIETNGGGASYFPGSIAGATATGGQYT